MGWAELGLAELGCGMGWAGLGWEAGRAVAYGRLCWVGLSRAELGRASLG